MSKIKQSPKRPAEERRRQLLVAARKLFMKKGFRSTSVDAIARRAGLTKGAVYFHFKKKEDILYEIVTGSHEEILAAFNRLPAGRANPADMLGILLQRHAAAGQPEFGAFIDFWAEAMKNPRVLRHLRQCLVETHRVFGDRVDPRFGRTRRERDDLAVMVFALFDGLTIRQMLGDRAVDFGRQVKLLSSLMGRRTTSKGRQRK